MNNTVLVVDDDTNARIITETLLRLRGLTVCSTGDGNAAAHILQRGDVAVVVVDLDVPGMSAGEIRQLRHERIGAYPLPRIIAVSSRTEPEVERFARRSGADAFLRKPLQPARLISTVEQLLIAAA
jgi:CheY-like chemotaxis protein